MNDMSQPRTALAVQQDRTELVKVLQNSLFPGAASSSVELAISYCEHHGLDIMQKPVHLVPMKVKVNKPSGAHVYEDRDVVMPGIGLYRVQASRTGTYAGMDEPVFGPTKTLTFNKKVTTWTGPQDNRKKSERWEEGTMEYPQWCKVVVYRLVAGVRCAFPAVEHWLENYATQSKETDAPNAMWEKRAYGQIIKCAEAQALRKAFPEVGSQPTADEMMGKSFEELDVTPQATTDVGNEFMPVKKTEPPPAQAAATADAQSAPPPAAAAEKPPIEGESKRVDDSPPATSSLIAVVENKLSRAGLTLVDVKSKFSIDNLEGISTDTANGIIAWCKNPAGN